jgi:hypothetical protein
MNRRELIKGCVVSVCGLSLDNKLLPSCVAGIMTPTKQVKIPPPLAWRRTVFCETNNSILKTALMEFAENNDCSLWFCENDDPDIHATGAFVQIVDRRLLGKRLWDEYVQFSDECYDDCPCILIDNIRNWKMPQTKYIIHYDPDHQDTVPSIIRLIGEMRKEMDRNLPSAFKQRDMGIS